MILIYVYIFFLGVTPKGVGLFASDKLKTHGAIGAPRFLILGTIPNAEQSSNNLRYSRRSLSQTGEAGRRFSASTCAQVHQRRVFTEMIGQQ